MELFALEATIDLDTSGFLAGLDVAEDRFDSFVDRVSSRRIRLPAVSYSYGTTQVNRNASAMSEGRVYNSPTVFGYADGAYQVAGDAGAEAVVGVNSLQRMIESAVRSASAGQAATARDPGRDINITLELDRQVFARAVYRSNNEECQRVGTLLATGGMN